MNVLRYSTYVLASLLLFPDGQTLPQKGVAHVSITNIETKAKKTIETFTIESICDLAPPPMEVQMNVLYILLSKMNKVMALTMLEDHQEALALLMRMETEDTLGNTFVSAFGKWYLFPTVNLFLLTHYHYFCTLNSNVSQSLIYNLGSYYLQSVFYNVVSYYLYIHCSPI